MAVEVQEVEVVPRPSQGQPSVQPPGEESASAAPHPDLERQIARTNRLLSSRDRRLHAD